MYRVLLLSFLEDLKVDESQAASLAQLSAILALSDAETNSVYTAAAGPLFRKVAGEAVAAAITRMDVGTKFRESAPRKVGLHRKSTLLSWL